MHEHARPLGHGIDVHLEGVEPVLECILGADGEVGELARLARADEPRSQPVVERRTEDEPARFGPVDVVDVERPCPLGQVVDGCLQ